jgi:hypothetical protein
MIVTSGWARTALSHPVCTGIGRRRLGKLVAQLADPWTAQRESRLRERRGRDRLRAAGAGPDHELPFTDRVIVTLICLRFQLPHAARALFYRVDRATITRAVGEIRPLLAAAASPYPARRNCAFGPWQTCSPTAPPRASSYVPLRGSRPAAPQPSCDLRVPHRPAAAAERFPHQAGRNLLRSRRW